MKIITICHAGTVRSVAMAYVLKHHGHDALPFSMQWNSPETLKMLGSWADLIIPMTQGFADRIPHELRSKVLVLDVGRDIWINSMHPELIERCKELARRHNLTGDGKWLTAHDTGA